jgi:hypothetical protein
MRILLQQNPFKMQLGPLKKEYGAKLSTVFEPASELVGAL